MGVPNNHVPEHASLDRIEFFKTDLRQSFWCDTELDTSAHKFQFNQIPDPDLVGPTPKMLTITVWDTRIEAFSRAKEISVHAGRGWAGISIILQVI